MLKISPPSPGTSEGEIAPGAPSNGHGVGVYAESPNWLFFSGEQAICDELNRRLGGIKPWSPKRVAWLAKIGVLIAPLVPGRLHGTRCTTSALIDKSLDNLYRQQQER